jgi:hypothetical protein
MRRQDIPIGEEDFKKPANSFMRLKDREGLGETGLVTLSSLNIVLFFDIIQET